MELYNNLSSYFKDKYGKRLKKICIDGGFFCPNRDGTVGYGGCIFCGERGAGEHIDRARSISEQVEKALSSAKDDELFVAYFQNFSNTYATCEVLKERYDAALISPRIKALAIGTRPDCLDEEKVKLLAEYKKTREVWVELGLQTASDETARIINRGYPTSCFRDACELLSKYGIPVVAHLIIGLPKEDGKAVCDTVDFINTQKLWGIKIHSIYVMEGTALADVFRAGGYTPPTLNEYVELAVYVLTHISPDLTVHRITGDCPDGLLVAPEWNKDKNHVISLIQRRMREGGLYQGIYYE